MTDLSQRTFEMPVSRAADARRPWPLTPYLVALAFAAVGLYAGRVFGGDDTAYEDRLLLLLRFMAVMKFAGVALAAALLHWRLRSPVAPPQAFAYLASLAIMAAATGLIWSLGAIALGAVLFHVGLLAFLVLAWRDDGVRLPSRG